MLSLARQITHAGIGVDCRCRDNGHVISLLTMHSWQERNSLTNFSIYYLSTVNNSSPGKREPLNKTIMESAGKWAEQIIPWLFTHGIRIGVVIVLAWILSRLLQRVVAKTIRASVRADRFPSPEAEKQREDTLIRIFNRALNILIVVIATMMVLNEAGIQVAPLIAGAGIAGLAVGFGGQYLIKDIITGLFLMLENQYRIGDVVSIEGFRGTVEDITLRKTTLRDADGTVHHIPHGSIGKVSNMSKDFGRVNMDIGFSYKTDTNRLITTINRVGKELSADPVFGGSIITPPQFVRISEFAESAMMVKIVGETKPLKQWEVAGELRKRLKEAFEEEEIEISLPQIVIHHANKE